MPRNCGCNNQCTCVIQGGSGVSITGAGRPDNPLVIEVESAGGDGSGFDPGDLKWSARASAPAGWLVADGTAVSRTTYATLFEAIGTLYGSGNGSTTFNLPDFTGRFALGADGAHPQGTIGGAEERTIGVTQIPAHKHSINHNHPSVTIGYQWAGDVATSGSSSRRGVTDIANKTGGGGSSVEFGVNLPTYEGNSGDAGGGQPLNVMPPYGTALPLIKT